MVCVGGYRCIDEECDKKATFNLPNEKKPIYCVTHKKDSMINVFARQCIHEGCNKQPSYNLPNEKKPIYCLDHKKENMINVNTSRCIFENCLMKPTFNFSNEKKPIYCLDHKKENMINVNSRHCIQEGCNKQPIYNLQSEKKPIYCSKHKTENMINVLSKRCIEDNCDKIPMFNFITEKKGIYCLIHKKENMVNVKNKKCKFSKCKELAIFGIINSHPSYCYQHKQPYMINLILENKCHILDCNDEYCNIIDNIKYCNKHIPVEKYGMVVKRLCKYCDIMDESLYVCKDCKKIQNKKEWAIVRHLRKVIKTPFEYNSSKMLQGCSRKRPDVFFELNTHCVIVEIDEHQHYTYHDICECSRINEIVNGIGGKSVIIIRYNPDTIKNNNKVLDIKQIDRIELLTQTIKNEINKNYDTFIVKTIQLYYNDNYEIYQPMKDENITDKVCI